MENFEEKFEEAKRAAENDDPALVRAIFPFEDVKSILKESDEPMFEPIKGVPFMDIAADALSFQEIPYTSIVPDEDTRKKYEKYIENTRQYYLENSVGERLYLPYFKDKNVYDRKFWFTYLYTSGKKKEIVTEDGISVNKTSNYTSDKNSCITYGDLCYYMEKTTGRHITRVCNIEKESEIEK